MKAPTPAFLESRDALMRIGDRRVWSIIVTVFGDLAREPDDKISGPLMSSLTQHMGIKPEATRVALHRLRKKGWIVSEKSGRESFHRLTDFGWSQSVSARERIYAREPRAVSTWCLAISKQNPQPNRQDQRRLMASSGFVSVGNNAYLGEGNLSDIAGEFLLMKGGEVTIPSWMTARIATPALRLAYDEVIATMELVNRLLDDRPALVSLEIATLRILIVHCWRYLVLRNPNLPNEIFPSDWPANRCRDSVFRNLDVLEKPTIAQMSELIRAKKVA